MRLPLLAALPVAAIVIGAGCSGSDSATPASTTVAVDEGWVTLPLPAPVSTTAPPATTRAPIEIRSFPDPSWPAVQVPTGPPVAPLAIAKVLSDAPGTAYDISPDGAHMGLIGSNGLCIAPLADPGDLTCADGVSPTNAVWSPDSSKMLFSETSLTQPRSGPLGTFATDGTLVTLLETTDPADASDAATAAEFVDDDTIVFGRLVVDDTAGGLTHFGYEVHTIGADGSGDAVVGTIDIGTGTEVFWPTYEVFDGTTAYFWPNGASMQPGAWRFDPEADQIGLVAPPDGAPRSAVPADVAGGLLLTADGERLPAFTSHRDDARFFTISSIDRSASAVIADLDADYMIVSAALSPDGAHLAAFEYYRGDDEAAANSAASGRVSIASTASLLRSEPEWTTITGVGPGAPLVDLDGPATIAWPKPDQLKVQLIDRAFVVDVGAA